MSRKATSSAFGQCRNLLNKKGTYWSTFLRYNRAKRMKFHFSAEMRNYNGLKVWDTVVENEAASIHHDEHYCTAHCVSCLCPSGTPIGMGLDRFHWLFSTNTAISARENSLGLATAPHYSPYACNWWLLVQPIAKEQR